MWCETSKPDLEQARRFAEAIHARFPGKLLAYNCSPSFNWKKNLDDKTIASFQQQLSDMGYKYQFITLAGIHSMWFNMFDLAHAYAQGEGMRHYVEKVQQPEFAAGPEGYTFVSHQQEVGTGYFDKVTTIIQGWHLVGNGADRLDRRRAVLSHARWRDADRACKRTQAG
ncbi:isocitrate lyase [Klebsiella pneumoniae]|uniref:Isocitrate lyase n=1 Tax=Klebsiella pneumoniae TaxID=573 RepID=A0A377TMP9_KLEPN|nr:isocitrate lyase [Klebsiella pneumoniae]